MRAGRAHQASNNSQPTNKETCDTPSDERNSRARQPKMGAPILPVWIWLEHSGVKNVHRYTQLNIDALKRHAPESHFHVNVVNRSNIASFVPDLPPQFWMLPTPVAFSDAGRLALLAHHGGLYIDSDFLIMRSLVPIYELLKKVDVVGSVFSTPHGSHESSEQCSQTGNIAANFIAARPNTSLFRMSWRKLQVVLRQPCERGKRICCPQSTDMGNMLSGYATNLHCRVPHALTDHMMRWWRAQRAGGRLEQQVSRVNFHCLGGAQELTPARLIPNQTSTLAWVLNQSESSKSLRGCYGRWRLLSRLIGKCEVCGEGGKAVCCDRRGDDLICHLPYGGDNHRGDAISHGFYSPARLAYHLYDSFQSRAFSMDAPIEWSDLAVAPLYRRALGLSAKPKPVELKPVEVKAILANEVNLRMEVAATVTGTVVPAKATRHKEATPRFRHRHQHYGPRHLAAASPHPLPRGGRLASPVCSWASSRPLHVSGHTASTLGESLNSLLIVFALALRFRASVGLPWMPAHQLYIPGQSRRPWFQSIGRQGIDLKNIFNMSLFKQLLPLSANERCLSESNASRVAVQLHRRGEHRFRRSYFHVSESRLDRDDEWQPLEVPPLNESRGFEALRAAIEKLYQRYKGPGDAMSIYVRMDAYPELSCALWGLESEIKQVVAHLEILQPEAPPASQSAVDDDLATSRTCGYAFFRGSSAAKIVPTLRTPASLTVNADRTSGFQTAPWDSVHAVPFEKAARKLASALRRFGAECVHLDIAAGSLVPLVNELKINGIRTVTWAAPDKYPRVRSPSYLRPRPKPMAANLLRLYYARHSRLFLVERGTCWGDLVTMMRSRDSMPTMTMQAITTTSELDLEEAPRHCVRIRGTCVDTTKPFPYRQTGRHPWVC